MKQKLTQHKKALIVALCLLLTIGALACLWQERRLSRSLSSQQAAERWRGESEMDYAQISCFVPVDEAISENQIFAFRAALHEELGKAAIESEGLWRDAWSGTGKIFVSGQKWRGDAAVIAVGGDFFLFHPLRLLSGSYLSEDDLMKDRVVLDENLAWQLFGGTDLTGMEIRLNDKPFVIAGVVEREKDRASRMAYTAGAGLYMSSESYAALTEEENFITCYELVSPEPVKDFNQRVAKDRFPIGRGEVLVNSGRFSFARLLGLLRHMDERSMQGMGMIYPYWENAARVTENRAARLQFSAMLLALLPLITLFVRLLSLLKKGKERLAEELWPRIKEAVSEAIRRPQRRRWEKKYGKHS